jgi:hypothetical protein
VRGLIQDFAHEPQIDAENAQLFCDHYGGNYRGC